MKILLKILVAPFALALSLLAALLVFLFDICAVLLTIASVILAVLGVALFFTPTPIGGIIFLFLAFLLSPYGLQAAAGSLLWALDGGKSALYRFLASIGTMESGRKTGKGRFPIRTDCALPLIPHWRNAPPIWMNFLF